ncbi:hypothetical protein HDU78_002085 [Chytriomyces hyalinus]|nr:hypothetical protein HDU78_002085 [Chytriomyces hyalinus]
MPTFTPQEHKLLFKALLRAPSYSDLKAKAHSPLSEKPPMELPLFSFGHGLRETDEPRKRVKLEI